MSVPSDLPEDPRPVLVTGATGFVGSHLVDQLLAEKATVRAIVRRTSNLRWLEDKPVELVEADLRDPASLRRAVEGTRAILHFGGKIRARNRAEFFRENADGTEALASAFSESAPSDGSGVFVYCSSLAAGGPAPPTPRDPFPHVREDDPPRPVSPYGESKLEGERRLGALDGRARVVVLRPPGVYGPRDESILRFFRLVSKGWLPLPARAGAVFSLIHVDDLVAATTLALHHAGANGVYYASDGERHSWQDIGARAASILGVRVRALSIPLAVTWVAAALGEAIARIGGAAPLLSFGKIREMRQPNWVCLPAKAQRDFAFAPGVAVEDGIRRTIEWYRSNGWLPEGR